MMISRRPNSRASMENAPGPSMTMASRIVVAKAISVLESKNGVAEAGSRSTQAPPPNQVTAAAIGVRKPASRKAADTSADKPANQMAAVGLASRRQICP